MRSTGPALVAAWLLGMMGMMGMPGRVVAGPVVTPLARFVTRQPALRQAMRMGVRSGLPETVGAYLVQAPAVAQQLARAGLGGQVLSPSVAALTLPVAELPRLLALPGLVRVDAQRTLSTRLDRSLPAIGAPVLQTGGLRGRGVVIAIVDTGIDFRRDDFRSVDGKTRIAYLLDGLQPRLGLHPELPDSNGMAVYTADDINILLDAEDHSRPSPIRIAQADVVGHGTHVAGIAAGNGRTTGRGKPEGRYVGVAPEATLCVVQGTRGDGTFSDADVIAGVRFCAGQAEAAGLPMVANLSLGSLGGPHDGQSAMEVALDEVIANRPGRLLVAAAGNAGNEDMHASSTVLKGRHEIPLEIEINKDSKATRHALYVELYYDAAAPHVAGESGFLDLALVSPDGVVLHAPVGETVSGRFSGEGDATIDNADGAESGLRGAYLVLATDTESNQLKAGTWRLRLSGQTLRYDLWMVQASDGVTARFTAHLDPDGYVEIPAAARHAISVGSYRTRLDWLRPNGTEVRFDRELLRLSTFSSGGPTLDGRFAPDILAPGEFIVSTLSRATDPRSARSSFFSPGDPEYLLAEDGVHGVLRGTSQATPHVAGGLALLLSERPTLTATQARELLRTTGRIEVTQASYGPRQGFGLLDLPQALAVLRREPAGVLDAVRSDLAVSRMAIPPRVGETTVTVTPRDASGRPLSAGRTVDLVSTQGRWLGPVVDLGSGRYERRLQAGDERGNRALITASVDGQRLARTATVYFVGEPSEIGGAYRLGGCTQSVGAGAVEGAWSGVGCGVVLLALGGLRLRRGRRALLGVLGLLAACAPPQVPWEVPSATDVKAKPARRGRVARAPAAPAEAIWLARESLSAPVVTIYLQTQAAEIWEHDRLVARAPICTGRKSHPTPAGEYRVLEKIPEHASSRYGDYVDESGALLQKDIDNLGVAPPPGAVFRGTKMPYFLRIFEGIGLHAGPLPGHPDSHGCVRFPESIAARMFTALPLGTKVVVVD